MNLSADLVLEALRFALDKGEHHGFRIACGIVDGSGRLLGAIKHQRAIWPSPDLALRKAVLATAFRGVTSDRFERWQSEIPLFGAGLAGLSESNNWFVAPGGAPVWADADQQTCLAGVGISGARPASLDQQMAEDVAGWLMAKINKAVG